MPVGHGFFNQSKPALWNVKPIPLGSRDWLEPK